MKKLSYFLVLMLLFSFANAKNIRLKEPPEELGKYYPPNSDKYEFLVTMYKMSTAFTGIFVNVGAQKWDYAKTWAKELKKNYYEVGKMVPSWEKFLKKGAVDNLVKAVEDKNPSAVKRYANIVGKSCMQCHKNYQLSVKVKYHYPSFDGTSIEDPVSNVEYSVHDYMKKMTNDMKLIKIYLVQKDKKKAEEAGNRFIKRVKGLQQMCSDCHTNEESEQVYFNSDLDGKLDTLRSAIESESTQQAYESINFINGNNCMKCHNVHQVPAMLKERFEK